MTNYTLKDKLKFKINKLGHFVKVFKKKGHFFNRGPNFGHFTKKPKNTLMGCLASKLISLQTN